MYIPSHFAVTQPAVLHRIVREHPLGVLVRQGDDGLDADHVPFEFDPDVGSLVGKSKLSQNKEPRDRLGAADRLAERGETELARRMRHPERADRSEGRD